MRIYTFQPQVVVDQANDHGLVAVEFIETNLYRQIQAKGEGVSRINDAYMWMARKLGEKTGIWLKDLYGANLDIARNEDGDYIDEEGRKLPVLPFWGWYITDGRNEKPDNSYRFDLGDKDRGIEWAPSQPDMRLVTLEIPENRVLLSDANAWYCVLEGRPCYEYDEDEAQKLKNYKDRFQKFLKMPDTPEKTAMAQAIWEETEKSWDNIFRLEGRKLRKFSTQFGTHREKKDIQAAFPVILKKWIVEVDKV